MSDAARKGASRLGTNAYLGISHSMINYFSRKVIRAYIDWGLRREGKFLFIVADHLEAHNLAVFRGISFEEALEKANETGAGILSGIRKEIPAGCSDLIQTVSASHLLRIPECVSTLEMVRKATGESPVFREDLRLGVLRNLFSRPASGIRDRQRRLLAERRMEDLRQYLLEEIAIIVYLVYRAEPRFELAVFPHPPLKVIRDAVEGAYGGEMAGLCGGKKFEYFQFAPIPLEEAATAAHAVDA